MTGRAQPGNERPRLFRLVADRAVVNRMGFNNDGAAAVSARLAARRDGAGGPPSSWGSTSARARTCLRPRRSPTTR